jgi:hypothetical protein
MEWFDLKEALIGFVLVAATVALVYGFAADGYSRKIAETDFEIDQKSKELLEIISTPQITPPPQTLPPVKDNSIDLSNDFCLRCHDKAQVSSFHFPPRIKAIEEKKGRPIRICTSCHGEPVMPVHFNAVQRKIVQCETCHIIGDGGFTVPQKRERDLLICQLCHARGNYIKIHIDGDILEDAPIDSKWIRKREGLQCITCHDKELYGGKGILDIHGENAAKAGSVMGPEPSIEKGIVGGKFFGDAFEAPAEPTTEITVG